MNDELPKLVIDTNGAVCGGCKKTTYKYSLYKTGLVLCQDCRG